MHSAASLKQTLRQEAWATDCKIFDHGLSTPVIKKPLLVCAIDDVEHRNKKMFLATRGGATGGLDVKTFAPYHILAARGFPPGCVNLSTLAHNKARRAAEAAMPTTVATAIILAAKRARRMSTEVP